ncbi:hypothetical protein JCGZ_04921 [Jatropha curcas]|uniref:Uncharacterized protein n=1 Tax=Jatropha curcas TaxID=180498 RepID=A0A067JM26_JATCU|nr:hypothetical protein JCGZ_04921 [Jatropha curcas]
MIATTRWVPPSIDGESAPEEEAATEDQGTTPSRRQRSKRVRRDSNTKASDTAIVFGKLDHAPGASFTFISLCMGLNMYCLLETHTVSPYWMSPPSCTHVSSIPVPETAISPLLAFFLNECLCLIPKCLLKTTMKCVSYSKLHNASLRASMAPGGQGQDARGGRRAGRGFGCSRRSVVIGETNDVENEDSEEMASYMS